ncbi:MAG: DUF1223 domain-containing protein [Rhodospirillaceae bacterium]|jgi:hypothetical protein|nr:DUF1223 domain-containing protein [Rhodospirillaceae bacterium]|tara:strand:+ start:4234 stop:4971 length:738 start_codon:yes stop_codon:yes gene_type:complete
MKRFFTAFALAAALAVAVQTNAAAAEKPLTVVELYTSQGCSSCPPADAFLGELAKRDDLLALSIHVDYWDYIGWKDRFALPENTKRQRAYASKLGMRYVYTPQMVVQGAAHSTGSDRDKILALIAKARKSKRVAVRISRAEDGIRVTVPGAGTADTTDEAALWLAVFDSKHETAIKRGENGGRTLSYYNVVRGIKRIGTWSEKPLDIPIRNADMSTDGRDGCAVILQSVSTGRILGAAKLALTGG